MSSYLWKPKRMFNKINEKVETPKSIAGPAGPAGPQGPPGQTVVIQDESKKTPTPEHQSASIPIKWSLIPEIRNIGIAIINIEHNRQASNWGCVALNKTRTKIYPLYGLLPKSNFCIALFWAQKKPLSVVYAHFSWEQIILDDQTTPTEKLDFYNIKSYIKKLLPVSLPKRQI